MTFAEQLTKITNGDKEAVAFFKTQIAGHHEEKMLQDCLREANLGRGYLRLDKGTLLPITLKRQGLYLRCLGASVVCCW